MHTYYDAKEMLHKELEEIVRKGELSAGSLETIDKLLNSIKNACKIIMYDEFDEGEYSQEGGQGGNSYAQRRDSRGRYSRAGGYSNEGGYSMARGGRGGNRGGGSRGGYSRAGYSYDDGKEEKVEILRDMMGEAKSEDERRVLNKLIRRMEDE